MLLSRIITREFYWELRLYLILLCGLRVQRWREGSMNQAYLQHGVDSSLLAQIDQSMVVQLSGGKCCVGVLR